MNPHQARLTFRSPEAPVIGLFWSLICTTTADGEATSLAEAC
jgi:hypothetical protein